MKRQARAAGAVALDLVERRRAPLATPTDLGKAATRDIPAALNAILADADAVGH